LRLAPLVGSGPASASDEANVDSCVPQFVHHLLAGSCIGEDDVDVLEIADVAERHSAELRGVGDGDNPLRGSGRGALHRSLCEKVGCDAGRHVDTARAHHERVEPELRKRMLGESSRQGELAGADLTPGEEKIDAWTLVQLKNRPKSERHDGHPPIPKRSSHFHRGGPTIEDDRLPIGEETGGSFSYRRLGFAGFESANVVRGLLGTEENAGRAAVHPPQASTALQRLKITPHGHLRAIECGGQLPDQHRTAFTKCLHDHLVANVHIHSVQTNINDVSFHTTARLPPVEAVVFDVGGVLLDWNPRHLYRKLIPDEAEMERFLEDVCSPSWHAPHDRGVSTAASCADLACRYPEDAELIWAWSRRSEEMIGGVDAGSVEVLRAVTETELPCYALTNMEAETYPLRLERFPFLGWFDGTVVSGREGVAKPEQEIFMRLLDRFGLTAETTLMIDDAEENLDAASKLGMQTALFRSSRQLRIQLEAAGTLRP
jgi:2-haloacid dehalogenase